MNRRPILFLLIACICFAAFAFRSRASESLPADRVRFFNETLDITQQARTKEEIREALVRYQALLDESGENGYLYYNIGNAYFKLNELGYAILNWRRALRLCPDDPDIKRNLEYGRSRRSDQFEPTEAGKIVQLIVFWHSWSLPARSWLAFITFAAFWLLLALKLFWKSKLCTVPAVVCLLAALGTGASAAITYHNQTQYPPAVLVAARTDVYQGNSETYEKVFTEPVHDGAEVRILEERGSWVRVEFQNGVNGWVRRSDQSGKPVIETV